METQVGRKPPLSSSLSSIFYYKENILQPCTGADSYQHAGTHLHKATTFSRLPASPGREPQPPALVYQPLLEGSHYPLLSFTSLSWKGATTHCSRLPASPGRELQPPALVYQPPLEWSYYPLTEGFDPQHHYRPRFINFQTGSNNFNTTLHLSTIILCPLFPTEEWNHCNQNIRDNPDFRIDMQNHIQP